MKAEFSRRWMENLDGWEIFKMTKTFMRADKKLLDEIKKLRLTKRESYAEVVKRLIDKENKVSFK